MKAFNAKSLINKIQTVSRVNESSTPEIQAATTKDKFSLNTAAGKLMGVEPGNRIIMMDLNKDQENNPEGQYDINERFIVAVDMSNTPMKKGKLSEKLEFAYSGTWGAVHLAKPEVTEIPHRNLAHLGIVTSKTTDNGVSYVANQKVIFDLIPFEAEDEDGNVVDLFDLGGEEPQPAYLMTNRRVIEVVRNEEDTEEEDKEEDM